MTHQRKEVNTLAENGSVIIKILGDDKDFSGKLKNLGGKTSAAMKTIAAGAAVAGAAVAALGKSAIDAYANYEQLVGGVETLFKESADTVQEYANNAFKTAGMSANKYMETVTSFSASLLQSLGGDTEAAAKMSDMAVTDMADNANKMGSSIDTIVQTYQSLSRGNYAMLDNLKLGYGGTKAEMERLIADAALLDESVKANDMSFGNMVKAIHAVQTEMGITGTTAEEASETISGSVESAKAAWENMLVGIADENADFDALLGELISSVGTAAENILPRIKVVLEGIGKLAVELAPTLVTTAVELLTKFGQYLSDNAPAMLQRVPELITWLAQTIGDNAPKLVVVAGQLIVSLATGLIGAIPTLVASAPTIVGSLADGIGGMVDNMVQVGVDLIDGVAKGLANAIPNLLKAAGNVGKSLLNKVKDVFKIQSPSKVMKDEVGAMLVAGVAQGINEKKSEAVKAAEQMSKDLLTAAEQYVEDKKFYNEMTLQEEQDFWEHMKTLNEFSAEELKKIDKKIYSSKKAIVDEEKRLMEEHEAEVKKREQEIQASADRISGFKGLFDGADSEDVSGKELVANLESQMDAIRKYRDNLEALKEKGVSGSLFEELAGMGPDAADEIEALNKLTEAQLNEYISLYEAKKAEAEEIAKGFFSVGEEAAADLQETSTEGASEGIEAQEEPVVEATQKLAEAAKEELESYEEDFVTIGEDLMEGVEEGVNRGQSGVVNAIARALRAAVRAAKREMSINSPSKVMATIGDYMAQGIGVGWSDRMEEVNASIGSSLSDGLENRMAKAYETMRTTMSGSMQKLSGDIAVQNGGNTSYTTNNTNNTEGDLVVNIEKIVNDGKGTVTGMMEELEFIRRQKAMAKGGA